jgi:hypothetical protein
MDAHGQMDPAVRTLLVGLTQNGPSHLPIHPTRLTKGSLPSDFRLWLNASSNVFVEMIRNKSFNFRREGILDPMCGMFPYVNSLDGESCIFSANLFRIARAASFGRPLPGSQGPLA